LIITSSERKVTNFLLNNTKTLFIEEKSIRKEREKERESLYMKLAGSMKEPGSQTSVEVEAMSYLLTATPIRENTPTEKLMVKEPIYGEMARCMMANGTMARSLDMVSGKAYMVTATSASGKIAKLKATESIFG
jgi:hypothetical protein